MYKVLIADDEHLVCAKLKKLIHWEELGLELLDTASDGVHAWEIIQSEKPEIVITDIRMPGVDGLELAKRASEHRIGSHFVLISGHTEFSYAFHAIKYGVEDYLIKPINEQELNTVLGKICAKQAAYEQREKDDRLVTSSLNKMRTEYLQGVIHGKTVPRDLDDLNQNARTAFHGGCLRLLAICLDAQTARQDAAQNNDLLYAKAQELADTCLAVPGGETASFMDQGLLLCLVEYPDEQETVFAAAGRLLLDEIFTRVNLYQRCAVTVAVSEKGYDVRALAGMAVQAWNAVCARLSQGANQLIFYEDLEACQQHAILNDAMLTELRNSMDACEPQRLELMTNRILSAIIHARLTDSDRLHEIDRFLSVFFEHLSTEIGGDEAEPFRAVRARLAGCTDYQEICSVVGDAVNRAYAQYLEQIQMKTMRPVHQAQQYIEAHLDGELTLEQVAAQVFLNPVYFSVIFKNETGVNFSKYVVAARIARAKELLRDPGLSIAEVAAQVGYKNHKHFTKLFKKVTGITPSEYRKLHL